MSKDANTHYLKSHLSEIEAVEAREEAIDKYIADNLRDRIATILIEDDQAIIDAATEIQVGNNASEEAALVLSRIIAKNEKGYNGRYNKCLFADAMMAWMMPYLEGLAEDELRREAERVVD